MAANVITAKQELLPDSRVVARRLESARKRTVISIGYIINIISQNEVTIREHENDLIPLDLLPVGFSHMLSTWRQELLGIVQKLDSHNFKA